jgi:Rhs element Vgr protein
MAEDSQRMNDELLELRLTVNGRPAAETIRIVSVDVVRAVNRVPYAQIILRDGDTLDNSFGVSNGNDFVPGSLITVRAGYGRDPEVIFEGVITKHSVRVGRNGKPRLLLRCQDKAVAMTVGRKNASFIDLRDSDVIEKLIADGGLKADVEPTAALHENLVQHYCSDWDFMVSRAEANGRLVVVEDGRVSVRAPDVAGPAVMSVTYGEDLMEFHADLDARMQFASVRGATWSIADQSVLEQTAPPVIGTNQGNLPAAKLAKVLDLPPFRLQTAAAVSAPALEAWTTGQQLKSALARIRGGMKIRGDARVKPGALIALGGVGDRFNGDVFVSAVHHRIKSGGWVTEVDFGLDPEWLAERRDLEAPAAAGLLPGVDGLQIGVVDQLDGDPDGHYRVRVSMPIMGGEDGVVWARLANFHASNGFGAFFVPEIGDEVVLGFVNDDPTSPVVLGSLYSSARPAPYESLAGNDTKAFVSREKLALAFDEDKKSVTIMTPGNNRIVISDDGGTILLEDQHNNKVELTEGGITLDSPDDVHIKAGGNITLDASGQIDIAAHADVDVTGMNVSHKANVAFKAEGAASAELSASGQTTVKGAMVMIN